MAKLQLCVDDCSVVEIRGWIDDGGPVEAIDIELNQAWVCTLSPTMYRADLERAGLGDGRRAFAFPLAGRLRPGTNLVAVRCGGKILYQNPDVLLLTPDHPQAHAISQQRWRGEEPAESLTWGRLMSGDTLWDFYQKTRTFAAGDRILEIGPGYGRLLKTAIERNIPFSSYTALELSQARVDQLREQFTLGTVRFVQGDIDSWVGDRPFDVVICSSTFEHLHPDCKRALRNIGQQLAENGMVFIDFIRADVEAFSFEETGTYVRQYLQSELRDVFRESGYTIRTIETCTLGQDAHGRAVDRFVVVAGRDNLNRV